MKDYYKIGRIKMLVARAAHIQSADIYVSATVLKHIYQRHLTELEKAKCTPLKYVTDIAENYNEIWSSYKNRILLTIKKKNATIMVVELVKIGTKDKGKWEVVTATRKEDKYFKNKKLLWKNAPPHSK